MLDFRFIGSEFGVCVLDLRLREGLRSCGQSPAMSSGGCSGHPSQARGPDTMTSVSAPANGFPKPEADFHSKASCESGTLNCSP